MLDPRSSDVLRPPGLRLIGHLLLALTVVATVGFGTGCGGRLEPGARGSGGNASGATGGAAASGGVDGTSSGGTGTGGIETGGAAGAGGTAASGGVGGAAAGGGTGTGATGTGGATGGTGTGGGAGSGATGGSTGGDPVTCPATCSSTAGSLFYFSSLVQTNNALVGRWQICTDAGKIFGTKPADAIGVEFVLRSVVSDNAVEGDAYYLVAAPGGAMRGVGSSYQAIYRIFFSGGQANIFVNDFNGYFARYSPCPEQMELTANSSGGHTVIAALD